MLKYVQRGQARVICLGNIPARCIRHEPRQDGLVGYEQKQAHARAEDVARENARGRLVSSTYAIATRRPTPRVDRRLTVAG